ncbi:MAG: hypothetical protein IJX97_04150 [Clostridia bacterium]|nr:hypothetical protein [Clostridia bacterium]MBQ8720066.1 hypothetical protein [Clostridia bacterium]
MKSLKKIATILLVVSLLAALLAVVVAAEGETTYTGTVDAANELLDSFDSAANAAARKTRINAVEKYFAENPIDPEAAGYTELVTRTVKGYLKVFAEISEADFATMLRYRNALVNFVESYPVTLDDATKADVEGVKTTYTTRVIEKARSLITTFESSTTVAARSNTVTSIGVHYLNYFIGTECDDYDELMNKAASAYVTVVNETTKFHEKKQMLRSLKNFMAADESVQWSTATNSALRTATSDLQKLYDESKEAIVSVAPLSEYSDQYIFCDFTSGATGFKYQYKKSNPVEVLVGDSLDPENKSMTITAANNEQTYFHLTVPEEYRAQSVVLEFDFLAETECSGYLALQAKDYPSGASYSFPSLCNISPSGIGAAKSKNLISGQYLDAFVVGEWVHISIIIDSLNDKVDVYVDYQYAGTTGSSTVLEQDFQEVRFDNYMSGTIKVDNIMFYAGTTLRDVNRLNNYSDAERFQFYSSFLDKIDNNNLLPSINIAHAEMGKVISTYWDGANYTDKATTADIKAAVDKYVNFDYEAFNTKVKAYNLSVLDGYMDEFEALGRTPDNIVARSSMITFIRTFMAQNVFDKENATYKTYDATLSAEAYNTELDTNINAFVNAMNRFNLAPVITTMEKYYSQANEFVAKNALDLTVLDDPNFKDFKAAYEIYLNAAASIEAVRCEASSRRFVSYMNYLMKIEGYDKESVWLENYALFDQYITACRSIIRSGVYTTEYAGWDEAYENYVLINEYLYENLQQTHLSEAIAMLDRFPESDTYVAKLGVCRYVRNYFAANDVDYTHPEIAAAVTRLEIYEDEVAILGEEYAVVLEQNTQEFISYVKQMNSTKDYSDLKAIYEASLGYYYSMNIESDAARVALAEFDVFSNLLVTIEKSSAAFIESATGIDSLTGEKLYDALVACYGLLDNISTDITGVSEAVAAFEAALDAYESKTDVVNAEIENVSVVVCAVRYSPATKPVAAVIKKIFE